MSEHTPLRTRTRARRASRRRHAHLGERMTTEHTPLTEADTCTHDWIYFGGVGAVGFEDGYECRKCGAVR